MKDISGSLFINEKQFYCLNMISFKCCPLLSKQVRILFTVLFITFSKKPGVILLISSIMLPFKINKVLALLM